MRSKSPLDNPQIRGAGEATRKATSDMLTESRGISVSPYNKVGGDYLMGLKAFFPYPLIALLLGVGIASAFQGTESFAVLLLGFSLVSGLMVIFYRRPAFFYIALLLLSTALGILRYVSWQDTPISSDVKSHIGSTATIVGMVVDEPDVREGNTHLTVRIQSIDGVAVATSTPAKVLVFAPRYPEYKYGDVLMVKGKIVHPKKFAEDDGRVFDYPAYLASKGVHYQIFFPSIEPSLENKGNILMAGLFSIKHSFQSRLARLFPEPHNALLGGLLLGGKQSLGEEWLQTFRTAGIIHIVVLSGYNMTIVAEWLVVLFRPLGFYGSLSMGGVGIVFFALMTGAGATVVRAAVMAVIALLARATGRTYTMGRALLFAGVLMVLHNPSILADDPSFQLSFLAALGLIFVSPIIERHTTLFSNQKILREVFVSTLATQAMVLPLLLYQTGMFSLVSLPANMLVLPVIPLSMLFGFIAGMVAIVFAPIAPIVALLPQALLSWILFCADMLARIPLASVAVPISALTTYVLYALLGFFVWYEHRAISLLPSAPSPHSPPVSGVVDKIEKAQ